MDTDTKVYVNPGDFFTITLPWSEVCMSMRVAEQEMTAELTAHIRPAVQLWKDGRHYSAPITTGEAGLYRDGDGRFYGHGITWIRDRPDGIESGAYDCACCSDIVYGAFTRPGPNPLCGACGEAGCEPNRDGAYDDCQRPDFFGNDPAYVYPDNWGGE